MTALAFALLLAQKEVAITLDDLPFAHSGPGACEPARLRRSTERLLAPLRGLPFTGFVVGRNCENLAPDQRKSILGLWLSLGGELGNHSWAHVDYNRVESGPYTAGIGQLEPALRELTGRPSRYFRSPMLHLGQTAQKRAALEAYLKENRMTQAPVTFDNAEWMFAYALTRARAAGDRALEQRVLDAYVPYMESTVEFFERRALEVVGRPIKHVLLIHANQLNAEKLESLLAMFRRRGYRFVSLEAALQDPAYALPDGYTGTDGISWIHRWAAAKGLPLVREPEAPAFIREVYQAGR